MWPIKIKILIYYSFLENFLLRKIMNALLVCLAQYKDSNKMGSTKPELHMRKLNKCTNFPFEPFVPLT